MAKQFQVRPGIRSVSGGVGLLLLLVGIYFFPLIQQFLPINGAHVYQSMPPKYGAYRYIGNEMEKDTPVDVLLVGASGMWTAMDPAVLKETLRAELGREPVIVNIGSNWRGEENYLATITEFTKRRKVSLVLLNQTDAEHTHPHELAKYWWRGGRFELSGIGGKEKMWLQGVTQLGETRMLWAWLTGAHKKPVSSSWASNEASNETNFGFNRAKNGWRSHYAPDVPARDYIDQDWTVPSFPAERFFFQGEENDWFKVYRSDYKPYQSAVLVEMAKRARANGAAFATVKLPTHFGKDAPDDKANIRVLADGYTRDWPVISIPQTEMFPGASFDQMKDFYGNESHFNESGARQFSRVMTPAITKLLRDTRN